jgi:hypothetical protein
MKGPGPGVFNQMAFELYHSEIAFVSRVHSFLLKLVPISKASDNFKM